MPRLLTRKMQAVANQLTQASQLLDSTPASSPSSAIPLLSPQVPQPLGSTPVASPSSNIAHLSPQIPQPLGSTQIASPSQNNDDISSNHAESESRSAVPETDQIVDKRTLIKLEDKKKFEPKEACEMLKIIVHSHFDGPYPTWGSVDESLKEFWWRKWQKLYRWDEEKYPNELIRKVFNHIGSQHLSDIFQKARDNDYRKPIWVKENIWEQLLEIWQTDETFLHRSKVNTENRAVSTKRGYPVYKGGSISTSEHRKRLKMTLGKDPSPKETFTKCYTRKDGTINNQVAENLLETFDTLVKDAIQNGAADGTNSVDMEKLWIATVGGAKKGDVLFGMGSHALSMIHAYASTYYNNDATTITAQQNLREVIRAEFMAELTRMKSILEEKVQQVESSLGKKVQHVESSLSSKVQQVEDSLGNKVEQLEGSLQQVETTIGVKVDQIHKRIDNLVDKETLFDTMTKPLRCLKTIFLATLDQF